MQMEDEAWARERLLHLCW